MTEPMKASEVEPIEAAPEDRSLARKQKARGVAAQKVAVRKIIDKDGPSGSPDLYERLERKRMAAEEARRREGLSTNGVVARRLAAQRAKEASQ